MPSPSFSVFTGSLFGVQNMFDSPADGSQRVFQNGNFVVSRHIFARQFELFLNAPLAAALYDEF
jgi:hypothetical protein